MNRAKPNAEMHCLFELQPCMRAVEFVVFEASASALESSWPRQPGAMRRGVDGWPTVLHFAPGRWLVPEPDQALAALIAAASVAGGSAIDVGGKWTAVTLRGGDSARVLAATIDVDAVLEARACAAVELFDCPALVASAEHGYRSYIKSSYAAAFRAALELQGAKLAAQSAP